MGRLAVDTKIREVKGVKKGKTEAKGLYVRVRVHVRVVCLGSTIKFSEGLLISE